MGPFNNEVIDGTSESVSSSESMNNIETMELANGEDSTQGNQEKLEPTDAPWLDKKKEDLKAEAEVGTGAGEGHTGKKQKEAETTSASILEDKKGECEAKSVGSSQHTNTGAGDGEVHTEENTKEAETTSASTLKDKKDESKTKSVESSQHTNTGAGDGEDSTHQEELKTTDELCLDMEKKDLKAEADIRAEQREVHTEENTKEAETTSASTLKDKKDESKTKSVESSQHTNTGAGDVEVHTEENLKETKTTSASTRKEKKDESSSESLGSSEYIGACHGETSQATTRQRTPQSQKKDEQKKDIENIGPKTMETTGFTVTKYRSQSGTLTSLIIILGLTFGIYLAFTFKNHQSDSPIERDDVSIKFSRQMDKVENQFRKQEPEFWRRTRIHLQRHLQTAEPTEPVSLILTAGLRAEKTLDCLARGLASAFSSAFSSAFNSSFLHIDGASKASQDSDQVKLDIDSKLQRAFEGGSSAAVIHRFEELPPGSTLIFYRYCDHENAAYKETFLIFTVLLEEEEEITANIRLSALEEMVDDYLKKKFLSDSSPVSYDRMDLDKYGGLWSRISHLILPVAADERIEHAGCQGT